MANKKKSKSKSKPVVSSSAKKHAKTITRVSKDTKQHTRNIKRNVKEVAKQIKKIVAPAAKEKKQIYSFRNIPFKGRNFIDTVAKIEANEEKFDAMLQPGEMWVATIFGNKTKIPYENIRLLLNKINEYVDKADDVNRSKLISNIKIMSIKTNERRYQRERKAMLEQRKEERDEIVHEAERTAPAKKKRVHRTNIDLLRDLTQEIKKLRAENKKLAKKSVAKKATTKRSGKKSKVAKPAKTAKPKTHKPASKVAKKAAKKQTKKVTKNETKRAKSTSKGVHKNGRNAKPAPKSGTKKTAKRNGTKNSKKSSRKTKNKNSVKRGSKKK